MSYNAASPLTGTPPISGKDQALAFLVRRGVEQGLAQELVLGYWHYATLAALDPLALLAQSVLETRNPDTGVPFASFWCSPPRRNLAGIGVTGERRPHVADGALDWQTAAGGYDYRGYAFSGWETAIMAHVVHLAAYVYQPDQVPTAFAGYMTTAKDPRLDAVNQAGYRGIVRVLGDLNGKWAVPGENYGEDVARIARVIATMPVAPGTNAPDRSFAAAGSSDEPLNVVWRKSMAFP